MRGMVAFTEPSRYERRACTSRRAGSASCAGRSNPEPRFHRNQQYSITALTDGSGSIIERYAYTAYGQPTFARGSGTVLTASAEDNRYTTPDGSGTRCSACITSGRGSTTRLRGGLFRVILSGLTKT